MTTRATLERSVSFELRDDDQEAGDGLTIEGLAAVFGQPTRIDSWEGVFDETIRAGAFRKSLRERTPVMQFDHGRHPVVGSIPIGSIQDLRETDEGLFVSGRLSDNWLVQPVRDAIAEGSITGMSFRFSVVREEWTDSEGKRVRPEDVDALLWNPGERGPLLRTLTEVKLMELGPVVWPAYEGTSVGVRARDLAATIRDDQELRREVRRSLACRDTAPGTLPDSELREIARALLFGDAPPSGHPSPRMKVEINLDSDIDPEELAAKLAGRLRSSAAPPADGHPAVSTDAPPADGHPSPAPTTVQERLSADMRDKARTMREHVASIADKDI